VEGEGKREERRRFLIKKTSTSAKGGEKEGRPFLSPSFLFLSSIITRIEKSERGRKKRGREGGKRRPSTRSLSFHPVLAVRSTKEKRSGKRERKKRGKETSFSSSLTGHFMTPGKKRGKRRRKKKKASPTAWDDAPSFVSKLLLDR